ncbi:hypothetical protein, partial [Geodermatophilus sp. SYSU D01176]
GHRVELLKDCERSPRRSRGGRLDVQGPLLTGPSHTTLVDATQARKVSARAHPMTHPLTLMRDLRFHCSEQRSRVPLAEDAGGTDAGAPSRAKRPTSENK